jgi:competence protein ComEA
VRTSSHLQLAVYAAIGVVLLLLGVRAVRESGGEADAADPGVRLASAPAGAPGDPASGGDVVVHVAGSVREPGVYRLPAGSRVADAIERAGGAAGGGEPNAINLAARLADGQQIVVPGRGTASANAAVEDGPISLGSADQADLEEIEGIGPVTAADIIAYRDEHGGVSSIEELDEIPGIGPATIESLSDRLQP